MAATKKPTTRVIASMLSGRRFGREIPRSVRPKLFYFLAKPGEGR
jgi:hypothetical protein